MGFWSDLGKGLKKAATSIGNGIKKGYTNPQTYDFFDVHRCSVLIGEQGTGKSTIAKLISTLLWLEKDIIQRRRDFNQFKTEDFIKLCKNQKIDGYFKLDSYICYKSYIFDFTRGFVIKR